MDPLAVRARLEPVAGDQRTGACQLTKVLGRFRLKRPVGKRARLEFRIRFHDQHVTSHRRFSYWLKALGPRTSRSQLTAFCHQIVVHPTAKSTADNRIFQPECASIAEPIDRCPGARLVERLRWQPRLLKTRFLL